MDKVTVEFQFGRGQKLWTPVILSMEECKICGVGTICIYKPRSFVVRQQSYTRTGSQEWILYFLAEQRSPNKDCYHTATQSDTTNPNLGWWQWAYPTKKTCQTMIDEHKDDCFCPAREPNPTRCVLKDAPE